MSEWFKDWFDTSYYHILYKNRDYAEAEIFIQNLTNHLNLEKGAKVLDLACGKGRHSIYLNQLGFDVLGVDLSSHSIECAQRLERDHLHFKVHDMRENLNYKFEAVFNLFTSIGYFEDAEDDQKVITAVSSYLSEQGSFVIDFFNKEWVIQALKSHQIISVEGIDFNIHKRIEDDFVIKTIEFEDEGKKYKFQEKVRLITLQDFERMAYNAGLKVENVFGDYNLATFDAAKSERLILELKRL